MDYSFDIKEEDLTPGRICLGAVKVEMGRIFLFGSQERLHAMVSFIPGLGNGVYEVYAVLKDVPGYCYRSSKVEIEFMSDEVFNH
ncbi:hypothetical protein P9X07_28075 [Bacillus thuringiensis]|nr:hypothetical protein [Bacillus thuringiensis]